MSRNHARLDRKRWAAVRWHVLNRDGWRCRECGRPGRLECHHVVALERGGAPFDVDNAIALCRGCHLAEHADERDRLHPDRAAWRAYLRGDMK